ncbi:hypothetical protein AX14_000955, partial [Amanita brunnescens Koide BX004]
TRRLYLSKTTLPRQVRPIPRVLCLYNPKTDGLNYPETLQFARQPASSTGLLEKESVSQVSDLHP